MITIDKDWTLFLDRDGVINIERNNDYVYKPDQFVFDENVLEILEKSASLFSKIIVVTNQRGIGRGLMTTQNLNDVHNFMLKEINKHSGRIDAIYFAPDRSDDAPNRKPNTGMADQALKDFPQINFDKSIMVGNNISDMEFGKRMKMKTIFLCTTSKENSEHPLIDFSINNLSELFTILQLTS